MRTTDGTSTSGLAHLKIEGSKEQIERAKQLIQEVGAYMFHVEGRFWRSCMAAMHVLAAFGRAVPGNEARTYHVACVAREPRALRYRR